MTDRNEVAKNNAVADADADVDADAAVLGDPTVMDPLGVMRMAQRVRRELGSRYLVEELLGQGAFATVWKVQDVVAGETFAAKRFGGQLLKPSMFFRELSALFRLEHPCVVRPVNLLELESGIRYLFLEYCPGGNLRAAINKAQRAKQKCPLDRARDIGLQIAQGLAAAHGFAMVHRDLKPENILFESRETDFYGGQSAVKLVDFGLVKALRKGTIDTQDDGVLRALSGSPAYMAPEQFMNQFSPASDFYALGVILYELVHGHPLFTGSPQELALQHLRQEPALDADLPDPWLEVLSGLLHKEPAARVSTAHWLITHFNPNPNPVDPHGSSRGISAAQALALANPAKTPVPVFQSDIPPPNLTPASLADKLRHAPASSADHDDLQLLASEDASMRSGSSSLALPVRKTKSRCLGLTAYDLRTHWDADGRPSVIAVASAGLFRFRLDGESAARVILATGTNAAFSSWDGGIWLIRDHELLHIPPGQDTVTVVHRAESPIENCAPPPPGAPNRIALICRNRILDLDLDTNTVLWEQESLTGDCPARLARLADNRLVVAEGQSQDRLAVYNDTGRRLRTLTLESSCWQLDAGPDPNHVIARIVAEKENSFHLTRIAVPPVNPDTPPDPTPQPAVGQRLDESEGVAFLARDPNTPNALHGLTADGSVLRWTEQGCTRLFDFPDHKIAFHGFSVIDGRHAALGRADGSYWIYIQ